MANKEVTDMSEANSLVEPVVDCEWGFNVPPDKVDLERIWSELMDMPTIYALIYLGKLKTNAPKTYARLRTWMKSK